MSFEPIEHVVEKIMNLYDRNPQGWSILVDEKGNMLVLGPSTSYKLRFIHKNPYEYTGVGVKLHGLEEIQKNLSDIPSYGFRPLTKKNTKRLLSSIQKENLTKSDLIKELFKIKTVTTHELHDNTEAILSGPIIKHPDLSTVSKGQKKLEARLNMEAWKLFRMKHPSRARIYG